MSQVLSPPPGCRCLKPESNLHSSGGFIMCSVHNSYSACGLDDHVLQNCGLWRALNHPTAPLTSVLAHEEAQQAGHMGHRPPPTSQILAVLLLAPSSPSQESSPLPQPRPVQGDGWQPALPHTTFKR